MKIILVIIISLITFLFTNCKKEGVSLSTFQESILEDAVYTNIPQLQSDKASRILKDNSVASISYIKEYTKGDRVDSLTYLRFDKDGKLIQRTTNECTTLGCLPYTVVQIYKYDQGRLTRVESYTFKKKVKSFLKKWLETDTSRLNLFNYENYRYSNDTIFVDSGISIWKCIKDRTGNIRRIISLIKSTSQVADVSYISTSVGIKLKLTNNNNEPPKDFGEYWIDKNKVIFKSSRYDGTKSEEYIYDDKGLLIEKLYVKDGIITARLKLVYQYYN